MLCAALVLGCSAAARADSMDLELSRLRIPPGKGGCPADGGFCPNDEAFERLVSDLSVGVAPAVQSGAATLGLRGFSIALSMAVTPISGPHWVKGSAGPDATQAYNPEPDGVLAWNRLEVRKGLPFGLEIGGMLGHGIDTSMWLFSGELRAALFEGYRSGLGALPDVAVRGVFQTLTGSEQLSMQTWSFDVTLSKPFVVGGRHRLTPIVALQALLVDASTRPVDLTPDTSAWDACAAVPPDTDEPDAALPSTETCSSAEAAQDLENTVQFADVHQTRIRAFVGLEEAYGPLTGALTLGFDLTVPQRSANADDRVDGELPRALTLHFVAGLRY